MRAGKLPHFERALLLLTVQIPMNCREMTQFILTAAWENWTHDHQFTRGRIQEMARVLDERYRREQPANGGAPQHALNSVLTQLVEATRRVAEVNAHAANIALPPWSNDASLRFPDELMIPDSYVRLAIDDDGTQHVGIFQLSPYSPCADDRMISDYEGSLLVAHPITQQEPVIQGAPVTQEEPDTDEDTVFDEGPVIYEEPVTDEESVTYQGPVILQESVTDEESVIYQGPPILEESFTDEETVIYEEPVTDSDPVMDVESDTDEEPVTHEEPVVNEEPHVECTCGMCYISEESDTDQESVINEGPVTQEEPVTDEEPRVECTCNMCYISEESDTDEEPQAKRRRVKVTVVWDNEEGQGPGWHEESGWSF
ncbi:hypothetical protein Z517_09347 [Fonsecaea pedrosoi CBS 271.37]|uniref:Uncharacterized protein n=1 Tax=Fonsecaea pedrosoi CBS 271.37 TaxID=1442368 RepID=A0A0D2G896_9EURO|nr:uncharacterized protein Z517_09347 [Fonsecaea pedrosoi CBS 271.37]KIW76903.1 hypothetical protein Z517_09347 [Fonsecaea pedrosoi CBS 271.37]